MSLICQMQEIEFQLLTFGNNSEHFLQILGAITYVHMYTI